MSDTKTITGLSKKTQNSIFAILIIIVVAYLSYGFYTATKIYKKSKYYYLTTAKNILYDIAQQVTGKTKNEVAEMTIQEIYNKSLLHSDLSTLLAKKGYNEAYNWFIKNSSESTKTIDEKCKSALTWAMNNQKTIFTKILY